MEILHIFSVTGNGKRENLTENGNWGVSPPACHSTPRTPRGEGLRGSGGAGMICHNCQKSGVYFCAKGRNAALLLTAG